MTVTLERRGARCEVERVAESYSTCRDAAVPVGTSVALSPEAKTTRFRSRGHR